MKRVLGAILVSLPFIAMLVGMVLDKGWLFAAVVMGGVLVLVGCIVGGISLLMGEL
ncbi:hypothetical protein AB0G06_43470 [Nonomuraea dietziae]|uniref:hypothetical protein n=1 Tax=Nonomuraea dietziae TaxID=65515 RepID=UPI00340D8B1A